MSKNLKTAHWMRRVVVVSLPLFISFSWITLVVGPAYPRYEYRKPDFPPDSEPMPLTQTERLELALVAVIFLESWQPVETAVTMLVEQQLPHTGLPLYTQRELDHLVDVKHITDTIRWLAMATAVPVIGGLLFLVRQPQTRRNGYLALGQGGLFAVILLSGIAGLILFGWNFFFYQFHGLLFPSGSWSFAQTDGLMRLYPERFFFDVGVVISVGAWLWGGTVAVVGYLLAWHTAVTVRTRGTYVQKAVR